MIQTYINLSHILYWRSNFQLSNSARLTQLPKRTEEEILTCCGRLWDDVPQDVYIPKATKNRLLVLSFF